LARQQPAVIPDLIRDRSRRHIILRALLSVDQQIIERGQCLGVRIALLLVYVAASSVILLIYT
jgi:hypothetical protein